MPKVPAAGARRRADLVGHTAAGSPLSVRLQVGVAVGIVVAALLVLYLLRDSLGAFVLGAILAFLINPFVDWLGRYMPRPAAIVVVFVGLVLAFGAVAASFVPLLSTEVHDLQVQAPSIAGTAQARLEGLQGQPTELFGFRIDFTAATSDLDKKAASFILGEFGNALSIGLAAIGVLLQVMLMLILAFLISLDAHHISRFARRLVPGPYRADWDVIWPQLKRMLRSYLRGQLTVALIIGVGVGVALQVEGVKFAFALGALAAITSLVPFVGPWIGAVPILLVALSYTPLKAIEVGLTYIVIVNIVLQFLFPRIVGAAVRLPTLVVIIAFLAGFSVGGILGMFVAIPVAATFAIVFDHVYPRVYGADNEALPG